LNEERRGSGNLSGISETTSTASDAGMGGRVDGAVPTLDFSDVGLPFLRKDRLTVCFALSTLSQEDINQFIVVISELMSGETLVSLSSTHSIIHFLYSWTTIQTGYGVIFVIRLKSELVKYRFAYSVNAPDVFVMKKASSCLNPCSRYEHHSMDLRSHYSKDSHYILVNHREP
jgi:hypothetical protein